MLWEILVKMESIETEQKAGYKEESRRKWGCHSLGLDLSPLCFIQPPPLCSSALLQPLPQDVCSTGALMGLLLAIAGGAPW